MLRLLASLGLLACAALFGAARLSAQDEATLRRALEGKRATLHMDMPATSEGVDVYPGTSRPVDFGKVANRLKKNGTAIRDGESILITKVKVKGENVEIHLGGGGYGTFGDVLGSELTNQGADSGTAQQARIANERTARLAAGSRFNVRFPNGVTPEDITPAAIARALADYVTIAGVSTTVVTTASSTSGPAVSSAPTAAAGDIKKGQNREEVERIAGAPLSSTANGPITTSTYKSPSGSGSVQVDYYNGVAVDVRQVAEQSQAAIRKGMGMADVERLAGAPFATSNNGGVMTKKYHWQGGTLEADYVNGVLVGYRISSN
jgi:hypothetical protein